MDIRRTDEFKFMKSMFPQIDDAAIEVSLCENNFGLDQSIEYILSMEYLEDDSAVDVNNSVGSSDKDEMLKEEQEKKLSDELERKLTGESAKELNDESVRKVSLDSNRKSSIGSIESSTCPISTLTSNQSNDYTAYFSLPATTLSNLMKITPSKSLETLEKNHMDLVKSIVSILYNQDIPESEMVKRCEAQIAQVVEIDPQHFSQLANFFWKAALYYFDSDIEPIINVACAICAEGKADETFAVLNESVNWCYWDAVENTDKDKKSYKDAASTTATSKTRLFKPVVRKRRSPNSSYDTTKINTFANSDPGQFQTVKTVDLHGLTVSEALSVTNNFVENWWSAELKARENIGTIRPGVRKAVGVASIRIITGKGLHSAGGVSRVRVRVANFLRSSGFLYEDEQGGGSFHVYGRVPG